MRAARDQRRSDTEPGISRGLVLLLAVACGAAVANLYYAQPLLHTLARAFGVSDGTAGLLVTVTQVGYVIGLALLVPVGDLRERRGLISLTLVATALALVLAGSVIALIVGIAALDLGVQGLHISNQSAVYALRGDARSRLTTAYMVSYFLGGAVLSALTSTLYASAGWSGVCVLGAVTAGLTLAVWVVGHLGLRPAVSGS
ncbi:MAG: MFS transporter [Actinomycetota bacterium]|nr:MFS transporter [Actinomycetota bacterium]